MALNGVQATGKTGSLGLPMRLIISRNLDPPQRFSSRFGASFVDTSCGSRPRISGSYRQRTRIRA